jgi:hypothetical protein
MRKSTGPSEPLVIPKDIFKNDAARSAATKQCSHCGESIAAAATSCCHCGQALPATAEPKKDAWEGYDI